MNIFFFLSAGTIKCVGLGDHDVSTSGETPSITRSMKNAKLSWQMHENYFPGDENTLPRHDIAILILDKPVDFQKYILRFFDRELCLKALKVYMIVKLFYS